MPVLSLVALCLPMLVSPGAAYAFDQMPLQRSPTRAQYVPNQVLVTLRPGMPESALSGFLSENPGSKIVFRPKYSKTYAVKLQGSGTTPGHTPADAAMAKKSVTLQRYSGFQYLDYNYYRYPLVIPNDEFYPTTVNPYIPDFLEGQWQFRPGKHIFAPQAWDLQKGSDQIIVAVIDSGVRDRYLINDQDKLVRIIHPDLAGRVLPGIDIADEPDNDDQNPGPAPSETNDPRLTVDATHGTHVAGIIAAQADNWIGVAGLCWDNVWIWPLKVGSDATLEIQTAYIVEAIYYCIYSRFTIGSMSATPVKVSVINLSLGGFWPTDTEEAAIRQAAKSGIIICAAAGNEWDFGPFAPDYPGAYEDSICVGATEYQDLATFFSNRGRAVDITAPGWFILSTAWFKRYCTVDTETTPSSIGGGASLSNASPSATVWPQPNPWPTWPDKYGNTYMYMSGTSMSTPVVAAAAALLRSHGVPASDVKELLFTTATPKGLGRPNDTYGWGVLNIAAALRKASIDVNLASPAKGSVVPTTRPRFRVDFRHARQDTIRVWIDGVDTNGDGIPETQPTMGGDSPEIADWQKYYYALSESAGKTYLLFEYAVKPERAVNGVHSIYVSAESDINFDTPPPTPLTDTDTGRFRVESQSLGRGWRLFSVPYRFTEAKRPEEILGGAGMLARWNYANNPFGEYALYSLDRTRTDEEATFTPLGAYASSLVHGVGQSNATPPAGLGYWLYLPSGADVQLPEGAGETVSESPYTIGLYYGWNMVGDPFTFPVTWANAVVEYAGERLTAEEAVQRGWLSNSFFRYDPVLFRYTYKPVTSATMIPWESQWVKVKVRTPDIAATLIDPWSDEFNDGVLDMSIPEPAWFVGTTYGAATEAGGMLRLIGTAGQPSYIYVTDKDYPIYGNFVVDTKLYLANSGATLTGGPANAEIRFVASSSGNGDGYSLSFRAGVSPNIICLRYSDTGEVIQSKQVIQNLGSGTTLYATIMRVDSQIKVRVGTLPGRGDIADWEVTDTTFGPTGCFRLVNDGMLDCRWDYFRYRSVAYRSPDVKIIVPPNAYTGGLY